MTSLAYIISAYRYPEQLVRLVRRLSSGSASFFIHVDRKTDDAEFRQMVDGLRPSERVWFLRRHRCDWGGFGHVAASLEGISAILDNSVDCDHVILLTGQDYPIKPVVKIERFLARRRSRVFLEHFPLPHPAWQEAGLDRIEAWHFRVFRRHYVLDLRSQLGLRRRFPPGFRPYGGSSYWCLTRDCIEYIGAFVQHNRSFVNFFRNVNVPDELFFQTIIMNSPFGELTVNDNLRYIEWSDPASGSPAVLRSDDLPKLISSPKLFARKFDATVDAAVLDRLDDLIDQPADAFDQQKAQA